MAPYTRAYANWQSGAAGNTPATAAAFNTMEAGIATAQDTADAAQADIPKVKGLTWNDSAGLVPQNNHAAIQDALTNYGVAHIPWPTPDQWRDGDQGNGPSILERVFIDNPVELEAGNRYSTDSAEICQLSVPNGENLDAVICSANWLRNSGAPSAEGRGITIVNAGIDGNWLDRQAGTPTELQTGGLGHGIAGAMYASTIRGNVIGQVRGDAINIDTTGRDGTSLLGECIELHIDANITKRTGRGALRAQDTANGTFGVTDFFVTNNVFSHMNIRSHFDSGTAYQDELGAAIFTETAGGWYIAGNHIYAADQFGGNYSGYPASGVTHGMVLLTANGTRVIGNQVADFGYHPTDNTVSYGIWARQFGTRPSQFQTNNVWTDEDGIAKDRYAYRFNMSSTDAVGLQVIGNAGESRVGLVQAGSPTMRGMILNGQGTITGQVALNLMTNMPVGDMLTTQGNVDSNLALIQFLGNSWQ